MKRQKLKIAWTCSDYVHHCHHYKWTAWLCGRIQYLFKLKKLKALKRLAGMFKATKSTPIGNCNGYKYVKKFLN